MTSTITVNGREYTVEQVSSETKGLVIGYLLTGKRGAQYAISRHHTHSDKLIGFPASFRTKTNAMDSVVFTDVNGELEVVEGKRWSTR